MTVDEGDGRRNASCQFPLACDRQGSLSSTQSPGGSSVTESRGKGTPGCPSEKVMEHAPNALPRASASCTPFKTHLQPNCSALPSRQFWTSQKPSPLMLPPEKNQPGQNRSPLLWGCSKASLPLIRCSHTHLCSVKNRHNFSKSWWDQWPGSLRK